jgi:hypothetical protein
MIFVMMIPSVAAQSAITLDTDIDSFAPGELVTITGTSKENSSVSIQVKDPTGKSLLIRTIKTDSNGTFEIQFRIPKSSPIGDYQIVANIATDLLPVIETKTITAYEPISEDTSPSTQVTDEKISEKEGGGCLIATATYGSEMTLEVQQLRELRDNTLLNSELGKSFMDSFNYFYYSFSPYIADLERENPLFKEAVKLFITPMISSLSVMSYAESDSEVLGLGIGVILLNLGMYLGVPAMVIIGIRKRI